MHTRYVRLRTFDRLRHSSHFMKWLEEQGTRLNMTAQQIFETLLVGQGMSSRQVQSLPAVTLPTIGTVTISGTAKVGVVLTAAATATGNPVPVKSYIWYKDSVAIGGATAATYTPVTGDIGSALTCKITATNSKGSASATSAPTAAVIA